MSSLKIKELSIKPLLFPVIALGLLVRIWSINSAPPSMYWDEMDAGYQAYSILKTGKDYFGNYPGLVVHSFADYRAPALIYLIIPFVAVFGLTSFAVKLPVLLLGTLTIYLTFILVNQLFKDSKIALIAALFTSFAPWNIQYSRIVFEAIPMLAFFLTGLILFFKGLRNNKFWILAAIFFSITLFTYNTMKLFIPLIVIALIVIFLKEIKITKLSIAAIIIFLLMLAANFYGSIFQKGGQRFSEISIFSDPHISVEINTLRHSSNLIYNDRSQIGEEPRLIDKILYNKPLMLLDKITQNYLKAFSPDFLFVKGDPIKRHSASNVGELYRLEVLTVLLGLTFLIINLKKDPRVSLFIICWILIAPLAAIITREGFNHATRLFMLFPVLTISSALGVVYFAQIVPSRFQMAALSSLGVLWLFCVVTYLNFYFGAYNLENAKAFQFGFNEAAKVALENKNNYEYVIIDDRTDSALMNYLFISSYDPAKFQALSSIDSLKYQLSENFTGYKLDNVILMHPKNRNWEKAFSLNQFDKNYLLIVSPEQMNEEDPSKLYRLLTPNQKTMKIINYKSGLPAFYVIESKKPAQNDIP